MFAVRNVSGNANVRIYTRICTKKGLIIYVCNSVVMLTCSYVLTPAVHYKEVGQWLDQEVLKEWFQDGPQRQSYVSNTKKIQLTSLSIDTTQGRSYKANEVLYRRDGRRNW